MANGKADSSRREAFEAIYRRGGWPDSTETASGRGSEVKTTEILRAGLQRWLDQHPDLTSGDFNWMQHVAFGSNTRYIQADIVKEIIDKLKSQHKLQKCSFIHVDIVTDSLPECDAWFCRDVLTHFPLGDGERAVRRFRESRMKYFLSTAFPYVNDNRDIRCGEVRAVNLEIAPFNLCKPINTLRDPDPVQSKAEPGRIRKYIGV